MAESVVHGKKTGKVREFGRKVFRGACVLGEPIANAFGGTLGFLMALPSPYKALGRMECDDVRKTLVKLIKEGESLKENGDYSGAFAKFMGAYRIMSERRIGNPEAVFMHAAVMGAKANKAGQLKPGKDDLEFMLREADRLAMKGLYAAASLEYARAYDLMGELGSSEAEKAAVYQKMMDASTGGYGKSGLPGAAGRGTEKKY